MSEMDRRGGDWMPLKHSIRPSIRKRTAHDPAAPEPGAGPREALAGVLAEHEPMELPDGIMCSCNALALMGSDYPAHLAAALAPEVARIETEAREAEREAVIDVLEERGMYRAARHIRSRP